MHNRARSTAHRNLEQTISQSLCRSSAEDVPRETDLAAFSSTDPQEVDSAYHVSKEYVIVRISSVVLRYLACCETEHPAGAES